MSKIMKEETTTKLDQDKKEPNSTLQVNVQIDDRDASLNYANAFRTNAGPEELIIDFGVNMMSPTQNNPESSNMIFKVNDRIIMNYYSVKRLALTLGQQVRRFEEQYGEIETDNNKRRQQ